MILSLYCKYYLSEEYYQRFKESQKSEKYPCGNEYKVLGTTVGTGKGTNSRHWVYDINEYMSTIDATTYKQPKQILVKGKINSSQDGVILDPNGISKTHTAGHSNCPKIEKDEVLRKLTTLECFRLMDFDDSAYYACKEAGISDHQMYKQTGNSIVVAVIYYTLIELYAAMPCDIAFGMVGAILKEELDCKLHCILPCKNYNSSHKLYNIIKEHADEWVELSDEFYKGCDNVRDQYMVDHCDVLLAVWDGIKSGGVWSTIREAQKAGKKIIYCPKEILEGE